MLTSPQHTCIHTRSHTCTHTRPQTTSCGPWGVLSEWGAGLCGSQSPGPAPSQPPNLPVTSVLEKFGGNEGEHCFCLRHPQGPPGPARPRTCTSSPRSLLFLLPRAIHAGQLPSHILHLGQEAKGTFSCPHAVQAGSLAAVPSTSCSASPRPHLWSHLEAGLSLQGPFAQLLRPPRRGHLRSKSGTMAPALTSISACPPSSWPGFGVRWTGHGTTAHQLSP